MKQLYYLFILDRSGSMETIKEQTIKNFNQQIDELKSGPENVDILLSLLTFDDVGFDYVYKNKHVKEVNHLSYSDFKPRGGTPLYDAIGKGVEDIQEELKDRIGDENVKILVTILTDGEENSSKTYTFDKTSKMIKHLQEDGKWVFMFMGCGELKNVQNFATSIGISASNTTAYDGSAISYTSNSTCLRALTSNLVSNYSKED